ncbi:MAG: ATP-binding protein [Deltaproteobacteria bacterium]|nr:ATP-binding protein [Deltaproteobacteria bacterium]
METVLSNITAGVLSFNAQGHISTINRRAREILGLGEDILGTPYREAFAPLLPAAQIDEFMGHMRGADRSFFEREVEVRIGGEARTLLARLTVLPSEQKSRDAVTAVMVIDDLTEVIKAKRISAWREIAQRIAHEVKNPLTPIQLAAQRLRKRYGNRFTDEDDQTFFESTATIIRQVSEMKKMVQEFSDFARMAEVRARPNQINDIIAETLVLYSEAHPAIEFAFQPASDLPLLSLDRSQVKRVFINLIDNAVDAMTGGGTVAIRTVLDPETRCARIEIADDGVGLPEGYRQRLYEPYFSTKKMGTGLGLAIVHQIMTDHGGRIELFENRPRGTRVVLTFPLDETADHPARAAAQGVS